jgi:hypothetical protein
MKTNPDKLVEATPSVTQKERTIGEVMQDLSNKTGEPLNTQVMDISEMITASLLKATEEKKV